jgi:NAD(P)-dependent dehydrogenase (short-subunit alcohol dehydrogenase family)
MSASITLRGRVAVVTGAGRGIGRAHAEAVAARGAAVVVNDLGTDTAGHGTDSTLAEEVAEGIRAAGGTAVADGNDIASREGAHKVVEKARSEFGRVDIVVNNAGVVADHDFTDLTLDVLEHFWRVHLGGHFNVTQAAWPIMVEQGHGRVIMTESGAGLFGMARQAAYCSAKGAVHGLMRSLAQEGVPHGILVNSLAPGAFTRMAEDAADPAHLEHMKAVMPASLVAPVIVWLSSDECAANGQVISTWGGRVARIAIGGGQGLLDRDLKPERIVECLADINSTDNFFEPTHAFDELAHWLPKLLA